MHPRQSFPFSPKDLGVGEWGTAKQGVGKWKSCEFLALMVFNPSHKETSSVKTQRPRCSWTEGKGERVIDICPRPFIKF